MQGKGPVNSATGPADALLERLLPGQTALGNYLMGDIPSDEDFAAGLIAGKERRELQQGISIQEGLLTLCAAGQVEC